MILFDVFRYSGIHFLSWGNKWRVPSWRMVLRFSPCQTNQAFNNYETSQKRL